MLSLTIRQNESIFIKTPENEYKLKYIKSKQSKRINLFLSLANVTAPPFQVLAIDKEHLGQKHKLEIEGFSVNVVISENKYIHNNNHESTNSNIHLGAPWEVKFARESVRQKMGFAWHVKVKK